MFARFRGMKIFAVAVLTAYSVNLMAVPAYAESFIDKIINKNTITSALKIVAGVMLIQSVGKVLFPKPSKKERERRKANFNAVETWAKMGETRAQYVLGYMYYFGIYMQKDKELGAIWWRLAAGQGHGKAMQLADMARNNEKIAKPNFADICYEAGMDAYQGTSADSNCNEAAKWLNMAISNGNKKAYGVLGSIYLIGLDGVAKNEPQAAKLFFEGMKQKDGLCFYQLGKMFMYGRGGINQDLDMAASLFMEASSYGIEDADNLITDIISGNVPIQVPELPPKDDKAGNNASKADKSDDGGASDKKSSDSNSQAEKDVDNMLNDIVKGQGFSFKK